MSDERPDSLAERQARVDRLAAEVFGLQESVVEDIVEEMDTDELTHRQRRFVNEYLRDYNARQAAIRAGYSPAGVESWSTRLLQHPKIARAIAHGAAYQMLRLGLQVDDVVDELALLAFSNISDYIIDDTGHVTVREDAPPQAIRAVSSVKRKHTVITKRDGSVTHKYDVELKLWDKPRPLQLLGRHIGMQGMDDKTRLVDKDGNDVVAVVVRQVVDAPQEKVILQHTVPSNGNSSNGNGYHTRQLPAPEPPSDE